jgi:hypothetical protein
MSKERDLLGRWHNGDLLPEEYMQLMKETKELLAQPETEQEPVAWGYKKRVTYKPEGSEEEEIIPLYTAPPKREPLSDETIAKLWGESYSGTTQMVRNFARAIEKAHGIIGGGE